MLVSTVLHNPRVVGHRWWSDPRIQGYVKGYRESVIEPPTPTLLRTCRGKMDRTDFCCDAQGVAVFTTGMGRQCKEDEDGQDYLNLNEEEGDVWDDSAYIEMLAKEVRVCLSRRQNRQ